MDRHFLALSEDILSPDCVEAAVVRNMDKPLRRPKGSVKGGHKDFIDLIELVEAILADVPHRLQLGRSHRCHVGQDDATGGT